MNSCGTRTPPPPCFSMQVDVFLRGDVARGSAEKEDNAEDICSGREAKAFGGRGAALNRIRKKAHTANSGRSLRAVAIVD
ncbi:hypothetical protein TNCV_597291 [Trichonephila clavipes]|nr:hypothetical protein TNCV_597291 [Trichonephila clavipes]